MRVRRSNQAFGGSTLEACAWFFERLVVPCYPRALVCYAGDNDLGDGRTPDQVLDGAQQGAIDNVKAHLLRGKKIMFGAYPGREFEAENDTLHFYARIYLVGTTLYQTLVVAPLANRYTDTVRFLDSFQLIARTSN